MIGDLRHSILAALSSPGISPAILNPMARALTEAFSKKIIRKGFLPEDEFHDGLILAESSLACIPVLITSDNHLLGIDSAALRIQLEESDLLPVTVCHPKALLKALQ